MGKRGAATPAAPAAGKKPKAGSPAPPPAAGTPVPNSKMPAPTACDHPTLVFVNDKVLTPLAQLLEKLDVQKPQDYAGVLTFNDKNYKIDMEKFSEYPGLPWLLCR